MHEKSVKASEQGLVRIKNAISEKGWNKSDDRWSLAASKIIDPSINWEKNWQQRTFACGCSESTRERLLKGDAIRENAFRAFCEALGLNPYEIAEDLKSASDEQNLRALQKIVHEFDVSDWQAIQYGCRDMNQDLLLPAPRKRVQEVLGTIERLVKVSRNELTQRLLPKKFKVYVKDKIVISHPEVGFETRILPTINRYKGKDGGYVAFYSSSNPGINGYAVGDGIYVIGQIRLQGKYNGRIFEPREYEGKDISGVKRFKDLCGEYFSLEGYIGAGGHTGGWFDFPTSVG